MEIIFSRRMALAAVIIVTIMLVGCQGVPNVVIITYQPLVNTKQLQGPPNAGSDVSFAVYCINKIENRGSQAASFDIEKLRIANATPLEGILVNQNGNWPWSAQNATIAAGTTEYDLGMIVLRIDIQGQPDGGMYHAVALKYLGTDAQPVHMLPHPNPPSPVFVEKLLADNLPTCTDGHAIP